MLDTAQATAGGADGFGLGSNFWLLTNNNLDGVSTRPNTEWTPRNFYI